MPPHALEQQKLLPVKLNTKTSINQVASFGIDRNSETRRVASGYNYRYKTVYFFGWVDPVSGD